MLSNRYELDFPFSHGGYLDLLEAQLYGWEVVKSRNKVEDMVRAIGRGAVFPAVPVVEEYGEYYLTPAIGAGGNVSDGGHHRAIAHHIACVPLHVAVLADSGVPYTRALQIPIVEIELVDRDV